MVHKDTHTLTITPEDLAAFQNLLETRIGLKWEERNARALKVALRERVTLTGIPTCCEYVQWLGEGRNLQEELHAFASILLVSETTFFRYPAQFEALWDRAFPDLIDHKALRSPRLSLWSAGCATGEEAYSLALMIAEHPILQSWEVEVLGTDVNPESLQHATERWYGSRAMQGVSAERKRRFFEQKGDRFRVKEEVAQRVRFQLFNLVDDAYPLPAWGKWDLILCRNVLIYLVPEAIKKTVGQFHTFLDDQGYLALGHSESLHGLDDRFRGFHLGETFLYQKEKGVHGTRATKGASRVLPEVPSSVVRRPVRKPAALRKSQKTGKAAPSTHSTLSTEFAAVELAEQARALIGAGDHELAWKRTAEGIALDSRNADLRALRGRLCADRGLYTEALQDVEHALTIDPLHCESRLLLASVCTQMGNAERAAVELRRCLYLEPDCAAAEYELARAYEDRGRWGDARRAYVNVVRILDGKPVEAEVRYYHGVTHAALLALCEQRLGRISRHRKPQKARPL